jgi:hypothetical protein
MSVNSLKRTASALTAHPPLPAEIKVSRLSAAGARDRRREEASPRSSGPVNAGGALQAQERDKSSGLLPRWPPQFNAPYPLPPTVLPPLLLPLPGRGAGATPS